MNKGGIKEQAERQNFAWARLFGVNNSYLSSSGLFMQTLHVSAQQPNW